MTVLGISVGTSRTGICVLKGGTLLDRHLHQFDAAWSDAKMQAMMSRYRQYVRRHHVTAIMVKIPPLRKHTRAITKMIRQIEGLAKQYGCLFDLITKSELKHVTGMCSTSELMEYTKRLYPELSCLHEKGASDKRMHFEKVFEAVLSAHVFKERQRARALRIGAAIE